ncbi:MAG TPA: hypothetical protein VF550_08105, partial [Polyangia bacterium]
MNVRQTAIGLTLLALTTVAGAPAQAQIVSAPIDLQVFRPAADTKGYITLNGAQILAPLDVSFGMIVTGGWRPLNLDAGRTVQTGTVTQESQYRMNFVLTTTLMGAIGIVSTDHLGLQFGIALPLGVTSGEATPYDPGAPNGRPYTYNGSQTNGTNDDVHFQTNYQGVGDLALLPKLRIINPSRVPVGISLIPGLILPTGDKSKFLGEGKTIFQPQAIVEANWGRAGVFRTALNLGMRIRSGGSSQFIDNSDNFKRGVRTLDPNGLPVAGSSVGGENTNMGIRVGNELLAGLGASWGIVPFVFD